MHDLIYDVVIYRASAIDMRQRKYMIKS